MREIEDLKDKLTEKIKTFRIINYITSFFAALAISSFIGAIGIGLAAVVIFFLALGGTEGLQYYYLPGGIIGFFALLGIFSFILIYHLYNKIYKSSINKEKYSFVLGLSIAETVVFVLSRTYIYRRTLLTKLNRFMTRLIQ